MDTLQRDTMWCKPEDSLDDVKKQPNSPKFDENQWFISVIAQSSEEEDEEVMIVPEYVVAGPSHIISGGGKYHDQGEGDDDPSQVWVNSEHRDTVGEGILHQEHVQDESVS